MSSDARDRLLDRIDVAHSADLGEITEVSEWYEQVRVVVSAHGLGRRVVRVTGDLACSGPRTRSR